MPALRRAFQSIRIPERSLVPESFRGGCSFGGEAFTLTLSRSGVEPHRHAWRRGICQWPSLGDVVNGFLIRQLEPDEHLIIRRFWRWRKVIKVFWFFTLGAFGQFNRRRGHGHGFAGIAVERIVVKAQRRPIDLLGQHDITALHQCDEIRQLHVQCWPGHPAGTADREPDGGAHTLAILDAKGFDIGDAGAELDIGKVIARAIEAGERAAVPGHRDRRAGGSAHFQRVGRAASEQQCERGQDQSVRHPPPQSPDYGLFVAWSAAAFLLPCPAVNVPAMTHPTLTLLLANPRGFCAGVDRAIQIVERAIEKYGAPVYVRHEIVHNRYVVEGLEQKGAIFVEELDEVPEGVPVIFSAHGVPKSVNAEAERRKLLYVDATCPLVSKVHREAERHERENRHILFIGHAGHPEVIGTMGQLAPGTMTLVESVDDARVIDPPSKTKLAFITQTTLSVDDTAEIVRVLQERFPNMEAPRKEDICYATTNRQEAVKAIADRCQLILVVGAPNSSNSQRLAELALRRGCAGHLVQRASEIDWAWFNGVTHVGLTAGASAPEVLVEEVIEAIRQRFTLSIETVTTREENVTFRLPRVLAAE